MKGNHMKRRSGFTLVELAIVIIIIAMLLALLFPALGGARRRAKVSVMQNELNVLDTACKNYKMKFGEYPPDFSGVNYVNPNVPPAVEAGVRTAAQAAVLRHLAKAFPRYTPGVTTAPTADDNTWAGFVADVLAGWNLDLTTNPNYLSPAGALTFWLGGQPNWFVDAGGDVMPNVGTTVLSTKPVSGFLGFSADPTNPFAPNTVSPSRIPPFHEFNLTCLRCVLGSAGPPPVGGGIEVWPANANGNTAMNIYPMVYFRAANNTYCLEGVDPATTFYDTKSCVVDPATNTAIYPAIDMRLSTLPGTAVTAAIITWVNPTSVQIFSAGPDVTYGAIVGVSNVWLGAPPVLIPQPLNVLQFPTGQNYVVPFTFDDVTNFSSGTLDDATP